MRERERKGGREKVCVRERVGVGERDPAERLGNVKARRIPVLLRLGPQHERPQQILT